jgi:hypothetical protein
MPLILKNVVPTSFTIDLSTIDKKIEKLIKFLQNSEIDLNNNNPVNPEKPGLTFVNQNVTYKNLRESFQNKKYKESLVKLVNELYSARYVSTRQSLQESGYVGTDILPDAILPIDDFGSEFDVFAAANTNPDNAILQFLNVKPYIKLKVDILSPIDFENYNQNLNISLDADKYTFLLSKLNSITSQYIPEFGWTEKPSVYYTRIINEFSNLEMPLSELFEIDDLNNLDNFANNSSLIFKENEIFFNSLREVEPETHSFLSQFEDSSNAQRNMEESKLNKARIKVIDNIIRKKLAQLAENALAKTANLDEFKSQYVGYNFYDQTFIGQQILDLNSDQIVSNAEYDSQRIRKEQLYFKLTFYKEEPQVIIQKKIENTSPLKVEFGSSTRIKTFSDPFQSTAPERKQKFVAIISPEDFAINPSAPLTEFFEPTILSILSDIDYIDFNIQEIDWTFCPPSDLSNPEASIPYEEYLDNDIVTKSRHKLLRQEIAFGGDAVSKWLIKVESGAFDYYTFPDLYFIPNILQGPSAFFKETLSENKISLSKAEELIRKHTRYYYSSADQTPAAKIARDQNANKFFKNIIKRNGFANLPQNTLSFIGDPSIIKELGDKFLSITDKYLIDRFKDIVTARLNIACLLKEVQKCFLPQTSSCRDVLKSFRFSQLEEIVKKAFPQSVYPTILQSINRVKIEKARDQREAILLEEIAQLEQNIAENRRRTIIFQQLDLRVEPGFALTEADRILGNLSEDPYTRIMEVKLETKLQEYRDLKLNQELTLTDEEKRLFDSELIDGMLDKLETEYGINTDILCDLVKLFDIFDLSFIFGSFRWPSLPEIDIYNDIKVSIDFTIIKLFYDLIISIFLKIVDLLTTCNGWKSIFDLATNEIAASVLGAESQSLITQIKNGQFDLDGFLQNNPDINPTNYVEQITDILNSHLTSSIIVTEQTNLTASWNYPVVGGVEIKAKNTTVNKLLANNQDQNSQAVISEQEIYVKFTSFLKLVSNSMEPSNFLNVLAGRAPDQDIVLISRSMNEYDPVLTSISAPATVRSIFSALGSLTGISQSREEIIAAASAYSSRVSSEEQKNGIFCIPRRDNSQNSLDTQEQINQNQQPQTDRTQQPSIQITPSQIEQLNNRSNNNYADLIDSLFRISPDKVQKEIQDKVYKPILIGLLPDGKSIKIVDESSRRLIRNNLKSTYNKFRNSTNNFYNNTVLKKKIQRKVYEFNVTNNSEGETQKIENQEFKDLLNKGGFNAPESDNETPSGIYPSDDEFPAGGRYIFDNTHRYVGSGIFKQGFGDIDDNIKFNYSQEQDALSINVEGQYIYTSEESKKIYEAFLSNLNRSWKIENVQTNEKNIYKIYENNLERPNTVVFSYEVPTGSQTSNRNYLTYKTQYSQILKNSIFLAVDSQTENILNTIDLYVQDGYASFLKASFGIITDEIMNDSLLKEIPAPPPDSEFKRTLSSIFPNLNNEGSVNPPLLKDTAFIDNAMKYINFCPVPTEEQKQLNLDPNLYGREELAKLILQISSQRERDALSVQSIQQLASDSDNSLILSIIDGLIIGLMRTACSEFCLRSINVLRTFKFKKEIIQDLMFASYVSEHVYNKIISFSSGLKNNRNAYLLLIKQHVGYIHDYYFKQFIDNNERPELFERLKFLKDTNKLLSSDRFILIKYKNKIENDVPMTPEYEEKLDFTIQCLENEIEKNEIEIFKLHLRNLAFNELNIIFNKLSYITSTNQRVIEELGESCQENINEQQFLDNFIINNLFTKKLFDLHDIKNVDLDDNRNNIDLYLQKQNSKFTDSFSFIAERYIYVPFVKISSSIINSNNLNLIKEYQNNFKCYGYVSIKKMYGFVRYIHNLLSQTNSVTNILNELFDEGVKYGVRLTFIKDPQPNSQSILEIPEPVSGDNRSILQRGVAELTAREKYKVWLGSNNYRIKVLTAPGSTEYITANEFYSSFAIPYFIPSKINSSGQTEKDKMGIITVLPFLEKARLINEFENISTSQDLLNCLEIGENNSLSTTLTTLTEQIKQDFLCDPEYTNIYNIYKINNLLSNILIFSSVYTLGNMQIKQPFDETKTAILNDINTQMISLNNEIDWDELSEVWKSTFAFDQANAAIATKVAAKAAVHVLQYYCSLTDPNISTSMLIRNAVKIATSFASQGNSSPGSSTPSELMFPFNTLLPYSLAQLPVNIFGIPPAGFGYGPPITIPGLILLGAEILLLGYDVYADENTQINQEIKNQLKQLCLDLDGYKKYTIE